MFNAFQWNSFNLVYTCNIALILFLKCDVTKFRTPPPLSDNVRLRRPPPSPLNVWRDLWMAPKVLRKWKRFLFVTLWYSTIQNNLSHKRRILWECKGMKRFIKTALCTWFSLLQYRVNTVFCWCIPRGFRLTNKLPSRLRAEYKGALRFCTQ